MTIIEQREAGERSAAGSKNFSLSVEPFVSKDFFGRFIDGVFRKSWINVGRVEEIPNNGDYFVKRIPSVESGVLVIRGKDGVVRAMHNVCPHRGNELVWGDHGKCARTLSCRFHGWAFSPDGSLAHVTDPQYFPGLDRKSVGLTPIHLGIWRGFIFVYLDGPPKQDLAAFLGDMGRRLEPYPFEKFPLRNRFSITIQSNWMVCMDAFQESYHAGYVHADWTTGEPPAKVIEFLLYDQHRMATFSTPARPPTSGIVEVESLKYGKSNLYATQDKDSMPGINPGNHKNAMFDCNVIFPNFFIDMTSRSYWVYRFWPRDYNSTTFEVDLFDLAPDDYAGVVSTAYSRARILATLAEDMSTLERTQRALESGAVKKIYAGEDEILVRHSHKAVTDAVAKYAKDPV